MRNIKSLPGLVITFNLLLFPLMSFAELLVDCNDSFVTAHPKHLIIDVLPNGVDDTENIQCALDEAAQKGVPIVRLTKGNFAISSIHIKNFKGSFQGTTRADTRLEILDDSIDCSTFSSDSRMSAAIKFESGEPKLKFMTVSSDQPCMATEKIRAIIHFTGGDAYEEGCKNDVIFALVDRVDMIGPGRREARYQSAIQASPEGMFWSSSCKITLLGSLKVNQSTVTGYETGVLTSMKAGAQVDINFNSFTNNGVAVDIVDSNQSTTITANTFSSENNDVDTTQLSAIRLKTRNSLAPPKTRLVVHKNQFMFTDLADPEGPQHRGSVFATTLSSSAIQDISLSMTDNRFQVSGKHIFIIDIREFDNWLISGNLFSGRPGAGIVAIAFVDAVVSGGVITANSFKNLDPFSNDIYFDDETTKCIVGPGQTSKVDDNGTGNFVL